MINVVQRAVGQSSVMVTRRLAAIAALLVVLSACGSTASPAEPGDGWVDPDGEPVDEDLIVVLRGDRHCDWESALLLHVGWPLGSEKNGETLRQYVRDPQGVFEESRNLRAAFDSDADLPGDAEPTGWATDGAALWLAAETADDVVYVVGDDGAVEQWPRMDPPLLCA